MSFFRKKGFNKPICNDNSSKTDVPISTEGKTTMIRIDYDCLMTDA
jgi:hypothetical protein